MDNEKDTKLSLIYNKEEDITEDGNRDDGYDNLMKYGIQDFINEEISEPDLMYMCKDDEEATILLKKCVKWMNEKNWVTMKNYLQDISKHISLNPS